MGPSVPRRSVPRSPGSAWTPAPARFTMRALPATSRRTSHMRVLLVHPSPLMYSELYLRLEPLGLERVAAAVRSAGHDVRLLDLQIFTPRDYARELESFRPAVVGFSVNYLANVPEVVDLAKATKRRLRD